MSAVRSSQLNWQSVYDVSLAKLRDEESEEKSSKRLPIVRGRQPVIATTKLDREEQALADAANALSALWKTSAKYPSRQ